MAAGRICLGMIVGVHGVRGHLKIKAYTGNPAALDRYGPLSLDDGRLLHLKVKSVSAKGPVIAMAQEVTDRDEAELMRGFKLFIARDALPPAANDEVYHTDLIGLDARGMDGEAIGVIVGLHDFGAGDIIEVKPPSGPIKIAHLFDLPVFFKSSSCFNFLPSGLRLSSASTRVSAHSLNCSLQVFNDAPSSSLIL